MIENIKIENITLQDVCRTCATFLGELGHYSVFHEVATTTKTNDGFLLADELNYLNVQIEKDDGLPQQVCMCCVQQLMKIHSFRLTCKDTQVKLNELFSNDLSSLSMDGDNDETSTAKFDESFVSSIYSTVEYITGYEDNGKEKSISEASYDFQLCSDDDVISNLEKHSIQVNFNKTEEIIDSNISESRIDLVNKKVSHEVDSTEFMTHMNETDGIQIDPLDPLKSTEKTSLEIQLQNLKDKQLEKPQIRDEDISQAIKRCEPCNKYVYAHRYDFDRGICLSLKEKNQLEISDSEFCCFYCDEKFESKSQIEVHIFELHPKDLPFQCKICSDYFLSISHRQKHFEKAHMDKNELTKCDICHKQFKHKYNVRIHKRSVHADGNYECSICLKQFTNARKYKYHMRSHDKSKQYKCKYCDRTFMQITHAQFHEESHMNAKEMPYKCEKCGKKFIHQYNYKIHLKKHERNLSYVCDICGKDFPAQFVLNTHKQTHNFDFQCEFCGKTFKTTNSLKFHRSSHVGKEEKEKSAEQENGKKNTEKSKIYAQRHREKKRLYSRQFTIPSVLEKHENS